jgi:hypothetical protein
MIHNLLGVGSRRRRDDQRERSSAETTNSAISLARCSLQVYLPPEMKSCYRAVQTEDVFVPSMTKSFYNI